MNCKKGSKNIVNCPLSILHLLPIFAFLNSSQMKHIHYFILIVFTICLSTTVYSQALVGGGINYQKAYNLYQQGNNDEQALAFINEGIKSDKQYSTSQFEYLSLKATLLFFLSRNEECIQIASEAINIKKEAVRAYYFRGLSYLNLQKDSLALSDFSTALNNTKEKTDVYYDILIARAGIYNILGRYDESLKDCNMVIFDRAKYSSKVYVIKALCYAALSNYADAKANCKLALEIDPTNEDALKNCELIHNSAK